MVFTNKICNYLDLIQSPYQNIIRWPELFKKSAKSCLLLEVKGNDRFASVQSCQSVNSTFKATVQPERNYTCCVMRYFYMSPEPKLGNIKLGTL